MSRYWSYIIVWTRRDRKIKWNNCELKVNGVYYSIRPWRSPSIPLWNYFSLSSQSLALALSARNFLSRQLWTKSTQATKNMWVPEDCAIVTHLVKWGRDGYLLDLCVYMTVSCVHRRNTSRGRRTRNWTTSSILQSWVYPVREAEPHWPRSRAVPWWCW